MFSTYKFTVWALSACVFASVVALAAGAQEKPWERSGNTGAARIELPPEARIDINHAPPEQLARLPGVTQVWAARIVRFRPYHTKVDLLDRGILPSAVYDRIKGMIVAHRDKTAAQGNSPNAAGSHPARKEQPKKPAPRPYRPPAQPSYSW